MTDSREQRAAPSPATGERDRGSAASPPSEARLIADLDEARRTIAGLEATVDRREDRFSRLFDSSGIGIIICDVHGSITEANDAFLEMLGYERDDLPLRWDRMTPPEYRALDDAKVKEVLSTGSGRAWEKQYIARDGRRVPVFISVVLLEGASGECVAIVRELSERMRLEAALRDSEQTYRTLYENIPLMYLTLATDGTIRSINAHGAVELGHEQGELAGRPVHMLVHPEDRPAVDERLGAMVRNPGAVEYWEARMMRRTGSVIWTRAAARVVHRGAGENLVLLACADVTRRRQAEQQIIDQKEALRLLATRLVLVEEEERRRIAAGLHDEIGHSLALAKLRLGQMPGPDHSGGAARTIRDVDGLLDQALVAIRSLTFELGSPVLQELGFEAALQTIGEEMERAHGIRFHMQAEQRPRPLARDVSVMLYRIVRELLMNVATHAEARSATVSVQTIEDQIRVAVDDDGVGFDATGAGRGFGPGGGFGLFSIKEQLALLGGRLEVESSPGRGTRAVVVAPLAWEGDET